LTGPYRQSGARGPRQGFFCPGCGGQVKRSLRHCPECDAGIATVRCSGCFHMNVPDDAFCGACGQALGLEPVGEPTYILCTRCRKPMQSFRAGPGSLYDCGSCGGQFVEHQLLHDLLERRERYGETAPRRAPRFDPSGDPVVYVKCPLCQMTMNRKNFGRSSGVIVDVCARHGTWFDIGELPRVLAFVEGGGLVEARRREQDEKARQAARERAERTSGNLGALSRPVRQGPYDAGRAGVDGTLGLLSFLTDLLS